MSACDITGLCTTLHGQIKGKSWDTFEIIITLKTGIQFNVFWEIKVMHMIGG